MAEGEVDDPVMWLWIRYGFVCPTCLMWWQTRIISGRKFTSGTPGQETEVYYKVCTDLKLSDEETARG